MARRREVERAKKRLLAETVDRDWMQGVGIGRVDNKLGLVINVRPGAESALSRLLNRLELDVPVSVRRIDEIRARTPREPSADADSMAALREFALSRLAKPHR